MTTLAAEPMVERAAPAASRPSWAGAVTAALLVTLEQPGVWVVSLAGFLARGGLLAFLLPIVVLPTPAGLQNALSPILRPSVLNGEIGASLVPLAAATGTVVVTLFVLGGLVGAWADVVVARRFAASLDADDELWRGRASRLPVLDAFGVRLLAHLPLALALVWGGPPIYDAAYAQLLTPFEVTSPLVLRIAAGVPAVLVVVAVAWLLGEAAGGLGVRELVLGRRGVVRSVLHGWLGLLGRPFGRAATLGLATGLVLLAVAPALVAAALAWNRLRAALYEGRPEDVALGLVLFVALWLGGLVLAAVATSARAAMWTAEWLRGRRPIEVPDDDVGTIGDPGGTDPGGWSGSERSGTV